MIKEVEGSLLSDIQPYSVILHQVNCLGKMGAGIALQLAKMFPDMYKDYKSYCSWFQEYGDEKRNHYDELLGTFHRYQVKNDLIICNAFAQVGVSRQKTMTNYDAWESIFRKIELQTRNVNKTRKMNWTIHCPYKMGCGLAGGDWDQMYALIETYFKDSPVEFVIHRY